MVTHAAFKRLILSGWLALSLLSIHTFAQDKVYVSDLLVVNFRTGMGNEFRIDKRLRSGTVLTKLEVSEDGVWTKVLTQDGSEGYVLSQYLVDDEVAKIQLAKAQTRLARLEAQVTQLSAENKTLKTANAKFQSDATSASANVNSMETELKSIKALSAGAIELDKRHNELLEKHQMIRTERDSLRAENESLKSDQSLSFMFYGAGILIAGMLIAVILPAIRIRKRHSDWA